MDTIDALAWFALTAKAWSILHNALAAIVTIASVVPALMVECATGDWSRLILCVCVLVTAGVVAVFFRC